MQTKSISGPQNNLAHLLGAAVKSVEKEFTYLFSFGRSSSPRAAVKQPVVNKAPELKPAFVKPSPVAVPVVPVPPVSPVQAPVRVEPLKPAPVVLQESVTLPVLEENPAAVIPVKPAAASVGGIKDIACANETEEIEVEIYFKDLQSPSRGVRMQALRKIKELSRPTAIAMIDQLLLKEQDILQIIELLNALASVSDEATTTKNMFKSFIKHPDAGVRLAALRAISKYHDDEAFAILVSALKDKEPEVRRQVLNCLCWTFGERCELHAVSSLHDSNPGVRKAAAQISGALKVPQAISGLITLLTDTDSDVQAAAAASLKKITGEDFGFRPNRSKRDKDDAIEAWRFWWRENQTKFKRNLTRG